MEKEKGETLILLWGKGDSRRAYLTQTTSSPIIVGAQGDALPIGTLDMETHEMVRSVVMELFDDI